VILALRQQWPRQPVTGAEISNQLQLGWTLSPQLSTRLKMNQMTPTTFPIFSSEKAKLELGSRLSPKPFLQAKFYSIQAETLRVVKLTS